MNHISPRVSTLLSLTTALCLAAASQVQAQATLASDSIPSTPTRSVSSQNSTWHDTRPDRLISAQVHDGVLIIDGMVAKVQLNYEIQHAGYMYFFVPGIGTAVVSLAPIADAVRVKNAFDGEKLRFVAGGHTFELSSKGNLLARDRSKMDVYVWLDRATVGVGRYPRMGFGNSSESPYIWPLSGVEEKDRYAHFVTPPPMPPSVLPLTEATTASPANRP